MCETLCLLLGIGTPGEYVCRQVLRMRDRCRSRDSGGLSTLRCVASKCLLCHLLPDLGALQRRRWAAGSASSIFRHRPPHTTRLRRHPSSRSTGRSTVMAIHGLKENVPYVWDAVLPGPERAALDGVHELAGAGKAGQIVNTHCV